MRTYSHAILTYAALRLVDRPRKEATISALGATLPDLPVGIGVAWLWMKSRSADREDFDHEVCGRGVFRVPDAAAHSFVALLAASLIFPKTRPFLAGWLGHLAADFFTHSSDARPQLWPLSGWRFRSPISYRELEKYGRAVTVLEHSFVAAVLILLFTGNKISDSIAGKGLRT